MPAVEQGLDPTRWGVIPRTLCFITHGDDVLLMKRAMHKKAFPGQYNGIGGHIERGEDILSSARREILEETGLAVRNLQLRGTTHIDTDESHGILLFVFTAQADTLIVQDSDEGTLHWVTRSEMQSLPLVADIAIYLERIFGAQSTSSPFFARVTYDASGQMLLTFAE